MAGPGRRDPAGPPDWPELAQGQPGPLYGVFGEEDFLVGQALEAFPASPAFSQNPELNIERWHAGEAPPHKVLESAAQMPFLGSRRLVMVLEAQDYATAQLNQYLDYLADPSPFTCLVFAGDKLNKTTKFAKALIKVGRVHQYGRLYPNQLPPWLSQRAKARNKRLARDAAEELSQLMGLGLGALDSELEKLSLFVGQAGEITLADVRQVVGNGRHYGIFDLTDALAAGDLTRALTAYHRLESLGEPAVRVLAMVARMLRQLLEAREVLEAGGGPGEVQSALRTPPSATRTLTQRARQEGPRLNSLLSAVLAADLALKSSAGADRVIMERLIMQMAVPGRGRQRAAG